MVERTSNARRAAFFRALAETGNQTIAAERAKGRVGGPAKVASAEEVRRVILARVERVKRVGAWQAAGGDAEPSPVGSAGLEARR